MEAVEKLSNRAKFVKTLLTIASVFFAVIAYFLAVWVHYRAQYHSPLNLLSGNMLIVSVFIAIYWSGLDFWLNLNEVYRSRSYAYVVLYHIIENVVGVMLLSFSLIIFNLPHHGRVVLLTFGAISTLLSVTGKILFYILLKKYRKKGYNNKSVVFVCDSGGESLLNLIHTRYEWGYKVKAVVGNENIIRKYEHVIPSYSYSEDIERLLSNGHIDELIYARSYDSTQEILRYADMCQDMGITFRLYSPFFNRLSANTQLRYFDTNAVITISNTPTNYVGLLVKRAIDIAFSSCVILFGSPFFLIIALLIKLDSKGPVFFLQNRSGLKGRIFKLYKFRSMVADAEKQRKKLEALNEMDGPAFKMTNDPRITRVGHWLRKSGIDEFPQFINVFLGDMSIVGPRPPLPREVQQYERWQLRRLAMKPGITCLWQIAKDRNSISFDDWMRMDMEYIDNWSLSLDIVIIFKTVRTFFRADGK